MSGIKVGDRVRSNKHGYWMGLVGTVTRPWDAYVKPGWYVKFDRDTTEDIAEYSDNLELIETEDVKVVPDFVGPAPESVPLGLTPFDLDGNVIADAAGHIFLEVQHDNLDSHQDMDLAAWVFEALNEKLARDV